MQLSFRLNLPGLIRLDRRVVLLAGVLVLLDAVSTYFCTLYYPAELEFNPVLRALLLALGRAGLLLYAPVEFTLLVMLLSAYSGILLRIGVKETGKYCLAVLTALYMPVVLNIIGVLHAVLTSRP
jgi:hypothetical protein